MGSLRVLKMRSKPQALRPLSIPQAVTTVTQITAPTTDSSAVRRQDAEAPETIDGIRVKRSGKRAKGGGAAPARPRVEKAVVNCLACGKVYDCRPVTNDIIMFLGEHAAAAADASSAQPLPGLLARSDHEHRPSCACCRVGACHLHVVAGRSVLKGCHSRRPRRHAESGGICTFCGAKVALNYSEQSETRPAHHAASAAKGAASLGLCLIPRFR